MSTGGILLVIAGALIVSQVILGAALERLGLIGAG